MSEFFCNMEAMNQAERVRYTALSKALFVQAEQRETDCGYAFTFPAEVSLAALAEWVALEQKCCPFFDFRIDLLAGQRNISLSLSGQPGIKPFILAELARRG